MNGWNIYCSLSIIHVHACKEEEEEEEEWGKDFQLMNEILIAWEEVLWAFHPCLYQLIA